MALYVDSAFLDDITTAAQTVPLVGITTNPSLLLAAQERGQRLDPLTLLREILQRLGGTIFMQPGAHSEDEMLREVISYLEVDHKRVMLKLPMTQTGLRVALRLSKEKHHFAFTAVTTLAQAYTGAMAGASFVIPYYNRLVRNGIDANERIAQMAEVLHNHKLNTRILAASLKSIAEVEGALQAGAHDLTIAPEVLLSMVNDPLSEQAIDRFEQDWQKVKKL